MSEEHLGEISDFAMLRESSGIILVFHYGLLPLTMWGEAVFLWLKHFAIFN